MRTNSLLILAYPAPKSVAVDGSGEASAFAVRWTEPMPCFCRLREERFGEADGDGGARKKVGTTASVEGDWTRFGAERASVTPDVEPWSNGLRTWSEFPIRSATYVASADRTDFEL